MQASTPGFRQSDRLKAKTKQYLDGAKQPLNRSCNAVGCSSRKVALPHLTDLSQIHWLSWCCFSPRGRGDTTRTYTRYTLRVDGCPAALAPESLQDHAEE